MLLAKAATEVIMAALIKRRALLQNPTAQPQCSTSQAAWMGAHKEPTEKRAVEGTHYQERPWARVMIQGMIFTALKRGILSGNP